MGLITMNELGGLGWRLPWYSGTVLGRPLVYGRSPMEEARDRLAAREARDRAFVASLGPIDLSFPRLLSPMEEARARLAARSARDRRFVASLGPISLAPPVRRRRRSLPNPPAAVIPMGPRYYPPTAAPSLSSGRSVFDVMTLTPRYTPGFRPPPAAPFLRTPGGQVFAPPPLPGPGGIQSVMPDLSNVIVLA
jgi:hypothetical protein